MSYEMGIDLVDVDDFRKSIERTKTLKHRLFTRYEIDYCKNRGVEHLASRFAAKEAFFKACGITPMSWKDIEVGSLKNGEPVLKISDKLKEKIRFESIKISLSQTRRNAIAFVMLDYSKK